MRKLMVLLTLLVALAACGQASKAPASLNGSWKADNFNAVISDNHIDIQMGSAKDFTITYWNGSFSAGSNEVESIADPSSHQASRDAKKTFTFKDGKLSFKFSILGTTRIVKLERS